MPTINFDGPVLSIDQKRSLIHGMSKAASQALGIPMAAFNVTLDEHEYSNMGIGGEVLTEVNSSSFNWGGVLPSSLTLEDRFL